jgi:phytoene desaturase
LKTALVIGSGFSGLSAATHLANSGLKVTVLEKNDSLGGRARIFKEKGFTFDMGPSWYWMPDVFERYFNNFGKSASDYYELVRLDPSYKVVFGSSDAVDIPANYELFKEMVETIESGAGENLDKFLEQAAYKYDQGINNLVQKPSRSITEFINLKLLFDVIRMDIFMSYEKHIKKFFHHDKILRLMEFPILFLGAIAKNTPALYSLMNYADIKLGTWYPMGGMNKIIEGMVDLAREKGVTFKTNQEVLKFEIEDKSIRTVHTKTASYTADMVIASADYHHVDNQLLSPQYQNYDDDYWNKKIFAPSAVIFYLGVNKEIKNLNHHNLFFDADFEAHVEEIYTNPEWPEKPLFYACVPSKTDPSVAPEGMENLFILIPVAAGIKETDQIKTDYFDQVIERMEKYTGDQIKDHIIYKRSFTRKDFIKEYNSFKGNAYGLANTLRQTAILKPSIKNRKLTNLYYTGQLTVPGPGVPPSLISGEVVAREVVKDLVH